MPAPRTARSVARFLLAWFALYLGAAAASPLLAPAGYAVICSADGSDLKKALVVGESVPLTLEFVDGAGRRSVARLDVPVRAASATTGGDAASGAHRH